MFDYANGDGNELAGVWFESGAVTLIVHLASVWVAPTQIIQSSESKEAIASYPDIQKELRLALQAVGRKLGMYMKRREKVKHEGERRSIFLRYLGEVATAVSSVNGKDRTASIHSSEKVFSLTSMWRLLYPECRRAAIARLHYYSSLLNCISNSLINSRSSSVRP